MLFYKYSYIKYFCMGIFATAVFIIYAPRVHANQCALVPDTLIMLDHSNSMKDSIEGQSKWNLAKQATTQIVTDFTGQLNFGLMFFPEFPGFSMCNPGAINVQVGPGSSDAIVSALNSAYPQGATPIARSLDVSRSYLKKIKKGGIPQYIILVTDGMESCTLPSEYTGHQATSALFQDGVKTYVIGFGQEADPLSLNQMAQAGGTNTYYQTNNLNELKAALQKIAVDISCCNNGKLDPGETCDPLIPQGQTGACITSCDDGNPCTLDLLTGGACNRTCSHQPITQAHHGDGCCPPGASQQNDNDCQGSAGPCGNGKLDAGETCDTGIPFWLNGHCPSSCDDDDPCTQDYLKGSGCYATCAHSNICTGNCGNGKLDAGETCDTMILFGMPGGCPSIALQCDDGNPNTEDFIQGSGCQASCAHKTSGSGSCGNGRVDQGEWCDVAITGGQSGYCPQSCDDDDSCTIDKLEGTGCLARCSHTPITEVKSNDGCCPPAASSANDSDCSTSCGNGVLDPQEGCDPQIASGPGACPKSCDDNDPCTKDQLGGSKCNIKCLHNPIVAIDQVKDGCCMPGMTSSMDPDCLPLCDPDSTTPCYNPCASVQCEDGRYCSDGQCVPWPENALGEKDSFSDNFEGGCSCRFEGKPLGHRGAWFMLTVLVALGLMTRRQR